MFILHSSNKTENLLEHLCAIISNAPLTDPFAKEVFLIQSQGMERWLSQQLAGKLQLFANFEFLFPGKFFSQMARQINQQIQTDIFARELMVWRIESLLRDLDAPVFSVLKQYISGENTDLKRFQLATHLAQIFDQYQMMRPMLLNDWQQRKLHYFSATEKWQQALWLKLSTQIAEQHRGALWLQAIAKFNDLAPGKLSAELPERISIFGLNTLPPLFMEFIQGLARHTDVHFYLLNPAQAFWADMVNSKRADLQAFENGHPLLASLGQQGREFQQMLLDRAFELELDSFEDNPKESLSNLQQLQNDMLSNLSAAMPMVNDRSISIHSCHTRMREVEVLKAQLLHALEADHKLELRDIVVMAPDIQQYAPFISGVFDEIQHAIADRSLRSSNSTFDAFLRFIRLTQSRFGWQQVMDLLSQAEVYRCFGLSETDVELIQHWVAETHIRWGKSAAYKKQLNLPETPENTWQAGLERLLMGYAVGTEDDFFAGILPYSEVEGSSAQALGGLHDFLQLLFSASSKLAKNYTLAEWASHLLAYADLLFPVEHIDDTAQQAEKQQLNEIFLELSEQFATIHDQPVSLSVILAWLEGRIEEMKSSNGFLRGQLTFCSMLPMRSIPFKVIALLGMNEGEFPHIDQHLTFDLLGKDFQTGDRSKRADDRYQFLEILLSARQQVIITYIGQSISENESIPASVVIHELLDVMQEHYQLDSLIIKHPLQSFSPRYFKTETGLISYSHTDFATAQALSAHKAEQQVWWQGEIQAETQTVIEVQDLLRFYRHPQKYFLQQQLNIRLQGIKADEQEHEPFSLEGMDSYLLNHQWIEAKLQQDNLSLAKLKTQGRWISGELGVLTFNAQEQEIDKFVDKIVTKHAGVSADPVSVDLSVGSMRLVGTIANQYTKASLIYRYTPMKGKDLIIAWLQHLILNRHGARTTHLISLDEYLTFLPEYINDNELEQFLQLYLQGQTRPNAFFTEATFAYIKQQSVLNNPKSRSSVPAIVKAQEALSHAIGQSYEPELQLLYKNLESVEELLNSEFEQYCNDLLLPAWEAANEDK